MIPHLWDRLEIQFDLHLGIFMAKELSFVLTSVSVVVTANHHNPSILTPDFLTAQGIVPQDWEVLDSMTTPGVSAIHYSERLQWTLDQGALRIVEPCEGAFQDRYEVHDLATRYIDKVRVVPYRSLGLNCQVWTPLKDPGRWLTERFLSTEFQTPNLINLRMEPRFSFGSNQAVPDAIVNLSVNSGQVERPGEHPVDAAIIDCNVHHPGPLDAERLISAIGQWAVHQDAIKEALYLLFGSDHQ